MAFSSAPAGTSSLLAVLRKLNSFSCYYSSFCALTPKHTPPSRGEVLKKSSTVGHSCVGVNWGMCYHYWSICTPVYHVNCSKWKSNLLSKEFQRPAACSLGLSFSGSFKSQHAFAPLGFLQNLGALLAGSFLVAP